MPTSTEDFDARMKAAGLIPIADQLAGRTPLAPWMVRPDMTDLDAFEHWLESQAAQYLRMQAAYDLGDKDKSDDMYDWICGRANMALTILLNYRAARAGVPKPMDPS